jgi:hypothetical protein
MIMNQILGAMTDPWEAFGDGSDVDEGRTRRNDYNDDEYNNNDHDHDINSKLYSVASPI